MTSERTTTILTCAIMRLVVGIDTIRWGNAARALLGRIILVLTGLIIHLKLVRRGGSASTQGIQGTKAMVNLIINAALSATVLMMTSVWIQRAVEGG